jgi:hypothetical protein
VIARVCMSVHMCVTKCSMNITSPDAVIRTVCLVKHQMLFALYLMSPCFCDDSNLLYSDISRGNELKPNYFASTKLGE